MEYSSSAFWNPWETEIPASSCICTNVGFLADPQVPVVAVIGNQLCFTFSGLPQTERDLNWGHRATYCSLVKGSSRPGPLGAGWFLSDFPFAVVRKRGQGQVVAVVSGIAQVRWFASQEETSGWLPLQQIGGTLHNDTVDRSFKFSPLTGPDLEFHSFDESLPRPLRGQLKRLSACDCTFKVVRSEQDTIIEIQWLDKLGQPNALHYEYSDDLHESRSTTSLLTAVTRTKASLPLERVHYGFQISARGAPVLTHLEASVHGATGWSLVQSVHCQYGSDIRSASGSPLLRSIVSRNLITGSLSENSYAARYDGAGHIIYVVHEGIGQPPLFL